MSNDLAGTPKPKSSRRVRLSGLTIIVVAFACVTLPVILKGAPLLDDYYNCIAPNERGLGTVLAEVYDNLELVRPAHYVEVALTAGVCRVTSFSIMILVPWALTIGVAFAIRGLLGDLGVAQPWRDIGASIWLLQPLGTEAALWPAALHIPLGIGFAVLAARAFFRNRMITGTLLGLAACLSVEQAILVMPVIACLTPQSARKRAVAATATLAVGILILFAMFPGESHYTDVSLADRISNAFTDLDYYVVLPATAFGAHSIPLAIGWAFPISAAVLVAGIWLGWAAGARSALGSQVHRGVTTRGLWIAAALLVLANIPVAVSHHPDSPRVFTPTWALIAVGAAIWASRVRWTRTRLWGGVAGALVAASLLSLSLSSWVRVRSATLSEVAHRDIASQAPDGAVVAVCDIERTMVSPAPTGDFALHDFFAFTEDAYTYYTGEHATFRKGGRYWEAPCPDISGTDVVVSFSEITTSSSGSVTTSSGSRSRVARRAPFQRSSVIAINVDTYDGNRRR